MQPIRPVEPGIGPVLRIAEWNVNRLDNESLMLALSDLPGYRARARANTKLSEGRLNRALDQVRNLQGADVIVFDEIDDGVRRSDYNDVPREIARRLHMNYAYGVEFIELNRIYLGVKRMDTADVSRQLPATERYRVDPQRDLGLEGTALLSRYPILTARIVRLPQEYDWYHGEIGAISDLEKAENWTARKLFEERLARQVRRGGRMMMVVRLAVPGVASGILTVVCPHLEDYSAPQGRRKQMDAVLRQTGDSSGPLVIAGDLNTLGHNGTPLTFKRTFWRILTDYRFWAREGMYFFAPVPGMGYVDFIVNYVKNYHDPTALNVPLLAPNHAKPLFDDVSRFRFDDGGRFDWAGLKQDSFDRKGRTLSDTNQRRFKGFATTFSFRRTYHGLVGEYKIDWIFARQPGPMPYRGRTLCELNTAIEKRISDHCPITADIGLN